MCQGLILHENRQSRLCVRVRVVRWQSKRKLLRRLVGDHVGEHRYEMEAHSKNLRKKKGKSKKSFFQGQRGRNDLQATLVYRKKKARQKDSVQFGVLEKKKKRKITSFIRKKE